MNVQLIAGDELKVQQWMRGSKLCTAFLAIALTVSFTGRAMAAPANPAASQTALSVSTDNSGARTKVTLNAHVAPMSGVGVPSGVVDFRSANLDLGSAVVDGNGDASLTTNNLPPGNQQVVAVYKGGSLSGSVSPSAQVTAHQSSVAGFTVTANPTTLSVPAGQSITSEITVTPVNSFSAYVSLSCTGLPATEATCTFNPTTVLASCSGSTCTPSVSALQIQTLGVSGPSASNHHAHTSGLPLYAFAFPAFLAFTGSLARLRKGKYRGIWNALLLLAVLLPGALALTACNPRYYYLNHGPLPATGTNNGVYTVTVNAISTTGSQLTTPPTSPQLTLTVTAEQ